jgi:hypothetical protein
VPRCSLGKFGELKCVGCKALFFDDEVTPQEVRKYAGLLVCCQHGKVKCDEPRPYPEELLGLKEANLKSLRLLNARLSLVAIAARRVPMNGFPFIFKIQGQVHAQMHHAQPLLDPENGLDQRYLESRKYHKGAQLSAFVDPALAAEDIVQRPGGEHLDKDMVQAYIEFLKRENPHYSMYMQMHEYINQRQAGGEKEVEVTLVFKDPGKCGNEEVRMREHTCREPIASNEVAALFDVGGSPDSECLYIHQNGTTFEVLPIHPYRDAYAYPVLFPYGEKGWHPKIKHVGPYATQKRNNVTLREFSL